MNNPNYKGIELLPLSVIEAARAGDAEAVERVLRYYSGYMNKLCTRTLYDENGYALTQNDEAGRVLLRTEHHGRKSERICGTADFSPQSVHSSLTQKPISRKYGGKKLIKSNLRNEIKSYIVRQGMTMQEVVDLLRDEHGWSDSVSNLSNKLQRESLRYMKSSGRGEDKEIFHMTDAEKKLLQAQHRLEEAQARDRVKERKARTHRLIQEGAILEKVLPEIRTMELSVLEDYLMQKLPQHD